MLRNRAFLDLFRYQWSLTQGFMPNSTRVTRVRRTAS